MSIEAMRAVWLHSQAKENDRLTLLAIADQADDDGVMRFPRSQAWLARKVHVTTADTVRRCVRRLEEMGELEVVEAGAGKSTTVYRIVLPGLAPVPAPARGPSPRRRGGSPSASAGTNRDRTANGVSPSFPLEPSAAGAAADAAADPAKPTESDPIKRHAHALAVLAMEQPVKPVLRDAGSPFPAVMALCERLIRGGTVVNDIETAIRAGVEVWTLAGLQTAIAKARPRRHRNGLDSLLEEIGGDGE